jgi:hypothetical protein
LLNSFSLFFFSFPCINFRAGHLDLALVKACKGEMKT